MTTPPDETGPGATNPGGRSSERKRPDKKLLDEIFGDVLPETTTDERASGSTDGGYSEEWYRENRPPHHGG